MKLFGSSRYVKCEGEYKDVYPQEVFLQLCVKSQWDWNVDKNFLFFNKGFSYYVIFCAKSTNEQYSFYKYAKEEDITENHRELITNYFIEK